MRHWLLLLACVLLLLWTLLIQVRTQQVFTRLRSVQQVFTRLRSVQRDGVRQPRNPDPSATCWKAVIKPVQAKDFPTTGMWVYGMEGQTLGICYESRAVCEERWQASDPQEQTWDGYCWNVTQSTIDAGW